MALSEPVEGLFTWREEGQEGGPMHSRKPHVPSSSSGVTIGRGFDMKERTPSDILFYLQGAGVRGDDAKRFRGAVTLAGAAARKFLTDEKLWNFEITQKQQLILFELLYRLYVKDVQRICAKADTVEKYGAVVYASLDKAIQDILVDLRFRGDYSTATRPTLQPPVVKNDLQAFRAAVAGLTSANENVPGRQRARIAFLDRRIRDLATQTVSIRSRPFVMSGLAPAGRACGARLSSPVFRGS